MNWLDKLERKMGRFAIKNLMMYIVTLNLAVFVLMYVDRTGTFISKLYLAPSLVLRGEIWRLITYIFIPPSSSPIFILFTLYFYYIIGSALEREWGSFRFNAYYLIGMLGTTIGAFLTGVGATGAYLNLSLFLAFASLYPDYEILIFFILPVKMKYLAWLNWAIIILTVIFQPLSYKAAAVASVINYLIFFWQDIIRNYKLRRQVYYNRKRFYDEINRARRNK